MPHFLLKSRMTGATWARLIANPEDRLEKSKQGAREFNGEHIGYWYSCGRYDIYSLLQAPDVITAGTLQANLFSSGGFTDFDTTALLTVDEMREAISRGTRWPSLASYKTPGSQTCSEAPK